MFTWSSIDDQQYTQPKTQVINEHDFEKMMILFVTSLNGNTKIQNKWKSSRNNF
jgi:hypothetical protein